MILARVFAMISPAKRLGVHIRGNTVPWSIPAFGGQEAYTCPKIAACHISWLLAAMQGLDHVTGQSGISLGSMHHDLLKQFGSGAPFAKQGSWRDVEVDLCAYA